MDPDGKFAGEHLKEFDGKQSQSATKEGLEGENERRFVFAGLKRVWDNNMNVPLAFSPNIMKNTLNMAYLGLMLLTFMIVHLFQFRFRRGFIVQPQLISQHQSILANSCILFLTIVYCRLRI